MTEMKDLCRKDALVPVPKPVLFFFAPQPIRLKVAACLF